MCDTHHRALLIHHPARHGCSPPVHLGLALRKDILEEVMKASALLHAHAVRPRRDRRRYILTMPCLLRGKDVSVSVKGNDILVAAEHKGTLPGGGPSTDNQQAAPIVSMASTRGTGPRIEAEIPSRTRSTRRTSRPASTRGIPSPSLKKKPAAKDRRRRVGGRFLFSS